jgi:chaperone required for assembly of F1-ATPase
MAAEWSAQREHIDPAQMPLTTLACSALDAVSGAEAAVIDEIVKYAGSDLLCYRADAPEGLVLAQARHWDPVLAWSARDLGACFNTATGLIHVAQPAAMPDQIRVALAGYDALAVAAVHVLTSIMGSTVLALAVARGHLGLDAAWAAAHVDEDWQIARWGCDAEAQARRAYRYSQARAAALVLAPHAA